MTTSSTWWLRTPLISQAKRVAGNSLLAWLHLVSVTVGIFFWIMWSSSGSIPLPFKYMASRLDCNSNQISISWHNVQMWIYHIMKQSRNTQLEPRSSSSSSALELLQYVWKQRLIVWFLSWKAIDAYLVILVTIFLCDTLECVQWPRGKLTNIILIFTLWSRKSMGSSDKETENSL